MSERAEIPEANDPFAKRVAITIAIMAVLLSVISNYGERAKTSAIIRTNEASDHWAFYQAKSLKGQLRESEMELLTLLGKTPEQDPRIAETIRAIQENQQRYAAEAKEIKAQAEELGTEARHESHVNERCEFGALVFQVAIVLCSVAILSQWKLPWFLGILAALLGSGVGISALFV